MKVLKWIVLSIILIFGGVFVLFYFRIIGANDNFGFSAAWDKTLTFFKLKSSISNPNVVLGNINGINFMDKIIRNGNTDLGIVEGDNVRIIFNKDVKIKGDISWNPLKSTQTPKDIVYLNIERFPELSIAKNEALEGKIYKMYPTGGKITIEDLRYHIFNFQNKGRIF